MTRRAGLDAEGTLQHVLIRGIESGISFGYFSQDLGWVFSAQILCRAKWRCRRLKGR